MISGNFVALNYACEEALVDYFTDVCPPLQVTASYYTGIGNIEDLAPPAVFVTADDGTELYNSNVYDITVKIYVKEMAADTASGSFGVLSANIFNAICDPSMSYKVNQLNSRSFSSLFIQKLDMRHSTSEDALVSEWGLRIIGCLRSGSTV